MLTSEGLIGTIKTRGNAPKPAVPPRRRRTDMNNRPQIESARTVAVERDDGRHAARIVMVSAGLLFALIFLLQAATQ